MRRNLRLRILPEEDVVRLAVDPVPVFAWIATIYLLCMYKVVRSAARLQLSPPNYAPSLLSFHSCQNYLTVWGLSLPWFASTPLILTLELLILTHRASRRTQTNTLGSLAPSTLSRTEPTERQCLTLNPLRQWTLSCWSGRVSGRGLNVPAPP